MTRFSTAVLFALATLIGGARAEAIDLTPEQQIGKQIYQRGESPRGPISALLGDPPMAVSASILPCVNCHGSDGLGRPEGGVIPTPLPWERLSRSYGVGTEKRGEGARGRVHRPYDLESFGRALREGVDPSGHSLNAAMIRYDIDDDDVAALAAYLKVIENDLDPGVDERTIRLAMFVPADGPLTELAEGVRRVVAARAAERNERGGIFGRTVELEAVALSDDPKLAREQVDALLADGARAPFAWVTPLLPRHETWVRALAEERGIPLIAPLGPPPADTTTAHAVFDLLPGRVDQACALLDALLEGRPDGARVQLVGGAKDTALLQTLARRGQAHTENPRAVTIGSDLSDGATIDRVLHLGDARTVAEFLTDRNARGRLPAITALLGAQVSEELFSAPPEARVFAAFPVVESAQDPGARAAYLARLEAVGIARPALPFAVADAAGALILDALESAGKNLRREEFIRALEGVHRAELGVVPPVTFGAGRRIGARGASIVEIDLEQRTMMTVTAWREVR